MTKKVLLFLTAFICLVSGTAKAQDTYGRIFNRAQADSLFGPILAFYTFDSAKVDRFMEKAGSHIMFNLKNGKIAILNSRRGIIYSDRNDTAVDSLEVFSNFSTSVLRELLSKGKKDTIFIEKRPEVISITNGDVTMEIARPCPPYCPD